MKCDRRWWNDGRLEREQGLHSAGYRPAADGNWRKPDRHDAPSLFDAARAVRPRPSMFDGAPTFGIGFGFENGACEPLSPERLKRAVDDLRKLGAKDYEISIPCDLSCKCGSKRPAYVDNDDGPVRYSGPSPKMPPICLDCGGTRS